MDAFLASLDHPHKELVVALRRILLQIDSPICEEIKWKVPSFRTTEHFATMHLRAKDGIGLIFHFGAKKRNDLPKREQISDPEGMLVWLAADRAMITFRDVTDAESRQRELTELVRQWIRYL